MFWRTTQTSLETAGILQNGECLDIRDVTPASPIVWRIIEHGERSLSESGRQELLEVLGERLAVEHATIRKRRSLSLLTIRELKDLVATGVDIQLHTHRHRLPVDQSEIEKEIADNRAILEPLAGKRLNHLCYPSGEWSEEQLPFLRKLEIHSATTCMVGMNDADTHPLALNRLLDADDLSQLEFEAEVTGFLELLRVVRGRRSKYVG